MNGTVPSDESEVLHVNLTQEVVDILTTDLQSESEDSVSKENYRVQVKQEPGLPKSQQLKEATSTLKS